MQRVKACADAGKPMVFPIYIRVKDGVAHGNLGLYDAASESLARFEPNGCQGANAYGGLDDHLARLFREHGVPVDRYRDPADFCGYPSFQSLEGATASAPDDPIGFCGMWVLWFADLRLLNPDVSLDELACGLVRTLNGPRALRAMIRDYAQMIARFTDGDEHRDRAMAAVAKRQRPSPGPATHRVTPEEMRRHVEGALQVTEAKDSLVVRCAYRDSRLKMGSYAYWVLDKLEGGGARELGLLLQAAVQRLLTIGSAGKDEAFGDLSESARAVLSALGVEPLWTPDRGWGATLGQIAAGAREPDVQHLVGP